MVTTRSQQSQGQADVSMVCEEQQMVPHAMQAVASDANQLAPLPDLPTIDFAALADRLPDLASLDSLQVSFHQHTVFQGGVDMQ